jgi:hypothetical protein
VYALKPLTIEAILSELRTRCANSEVETTKAQYFMWKCQEEAKRRGFLLWAPKSKAQTDSPATPGTPPPTPPPHVFDVGALKGAATVGNRGVVRDLKAYATEEEL